MHYSLSWMGENAFGKGTDVGDDLSATLTVVSCPRFTTPLSGGKLPNPGQEVQGRKECMRGGFSKGLKGSEEVTSSSLI